MAAMIVLTAVLQLHLAFSQDGNSPDHPVMEQVRGAGERSAYSPRNDVMFLCVMHARRGDPLMAIAPSREPWRAHMTLSCLFPEECRWLVFRCDYHGEETCRYHKLMPSIQYRALFRKPCKNCLPIIRRLHTMQWYVKSAQEGSGTCPTRIITPFASHCSSI